jgi:hypothetical protein
MNNIVLYRICLSFGILLLATTVAAQKPSIDLIPSSYQHMPPEAIMDTSLRSDSTIQKIYGLDPGIQEKKDAGVHVKKERRQIGPSIDSLLRKSEDKKTVSERSAGKLSLRIRQLNPIRFFIRISAKNRNL